MTQEDLSAIIGKAVTDKNFLDTLCEYLMRHDKDALKSFLVDTARYNLDDAELDYLAKKHDIDICQTLRILSKSLEVKYEQTGDHSTKRW